MPTCIFPENELSETVSPAIINTIKEKSKLLDQWRDYHHSKYGNTHNTPLSDSMGLTKLKGGGVMSDTCLPARAISRMTVDAVEKTIKEKAALDGDKYEPSLV